MNNLGQGGRFYSGSIPVGPIVKQHSIPTQASAVSVIFRAGMACGVLDLTAAFVTWSLQGVSPYRILQAIASGLLGADSFHGGWPTALLGLACHFFIAFCAATLFYFGSYKLKFMTERPILAGFAFGIAVYLVMYWLVMPLSRIEPAVLYGPHAHRDRHSHVLRRSAHFPHRPPLHRVATILAAGGAAAFSTGQIWPTIHELTGGD